MEELSALQQGYYYLSKHQFDEAKRSFEQLVKGECEDAHPYIGLLLAENGLVSEGQLADLPKTLESYPLFMKGLANAKGTYREGLLEIRAKQNLRLLKKEELYLELQREMTAELSTKEACTRLLGMVTELRGYKKSEEIGAQIKVRLEEIESAERAKRKKRTAILLPISAVVAVLLLAGVFFFTLPSRGGVRYVWTLDGYATLSVDRSCTEVVLVEEIYGISVTSVGRSSFKDCTALEKVVLNERVNTIEKSAFNGCVALKTVQGAEKVDTVYSKAFKDCKSLEGIRLKEGAFVEDNAFRGCQRTVAVFLGDELLAVQTESKK
jgi:hypothetical protein